MLARLRAFFSSNAILIVMPEAAEEISQQPEVRKELQRATGEKPREKVKAHGREKLWFVTHTLILVGCAVLYFLLGSKLIPLPHPTIDIAGRVLRGAALIVIVLAIAKAASYMDSVVLRMLPPVSPFSASCIWSLPFLSRSLLYR